MPGKEEYSSTLPFCPSLVLKVKKPILMWLFPGSISLLKWNLSVLSVEKVQAVYYALHSAGFQPLMQSKWTSA